MSFSLQKLTHVEVTSLWNKRNEIFKEQSVDLKSNEVIDSAGIAFLVQWAKNTPSKRLTILNASNNVKSLIKTFRLGDLFEMQNS